jgi:type II secretory pathway component GspD/PulD (secretin)
MRKIIAAFFSVFLIALACAQEEPLPLDNGAAEYQPPPENQPAGEMAITPPTAQNKISLDIKGMDVIDVLKLFSNRAGLNLVVGKNVTGRVTLFLKDVDIWDAFELILLANDLAYDKKGNIINVMSQRDYELLYGDRFQDKKQAKIVQLRFAKAADLSRALNQIKSNVGRIVVDEGSNTLALIDLPQTVKAMEDFIRNTDLQLKTQVFGLNYAQADKISPKLQEIITKGIGSLRIDERTNKIVITDYPEKLVELERIISAFDEKTPQVLIDAQIIEVKPSDKFEMGVDWAYWIEKYFKIAASLPMGADTNRLILGTPNTTPGSVGKYKGVLDILRTIGDTKILSSPRIMVLNNQEAKILVGTKDAYITSTTSQSGTGTAVTSQSVNFVDVGIKLFVTPTINKYGFVTMKIRPEVSTSEAKTIVSEDKKTEIPIVTTSETETTVMVKDGVTIIIGGLRKDERKKTVKKIPLLGDIPYLGVFLRSTTDEYKKTDLVVLLTPHIMSGESAFTEIETMHPKQGMVAKMKGGKIVTERFTSHKPENYNQQVIARINEYAEKGCGSGKEGNVDMEFGILADGRLAGDPRILQASEPGLAELAARAIKDAAPFPPLPKDSGKPQELFRIKLMYEPKEPLEKQVK